MKKAKIQCPYFILLVVTSILFIFLYQMKENGFIAFTKGSFEKGNAEADSDSSGEIAESISGDKGIEQGDRQGKEEISISGNDMPENTQQGSSVSGNETDSVRKTESPEEYLADTLFIGDSRTASLKEYAGWDTAHFYVKYGLTIWDVLDEKIAEYDGEKISVEEALQKEKFGKIYIMLGINELGRGTPETFAEQYGKVVERIKKLQPDAVIVVEAIMHVTAEKDAEKTYINNEEINARNAQIKQMAENAGVEWLDVNPATDDEETGCLMSAYSFDGVHLKVKYLDVWKEFILANRF